MAAVLKVLLKEVRARPELWQSSHPLFRNKHMTNKSWLQISQKVKLDVAVLKKKWKQLKDQYRKELKKGPPPNMPPGVEWEPMWQYYKPMSFLHDELLVPRRRPKPPEEVTIDESLLQDTEPFDDENSSESGPSLLQVKTENQTNEAEFSSEEQRSNASTPEQRTLNSFLEDILALEQKKIQLMEQRANLVNKNNDPNFDPDLLFFKSIMSNVKSLTDYQKLQFRTKVNEILIEFMIENEKQQ